ncbi:phosphotransferase [Amycolatopsis suaedae]|nr:phosphotransferase [Amycolatopsis suaedae]
MAAPLTLLTGETAGDLLGAVLAEAGGVVEQWSATQVDHQPGRRTTVSYSARVRWPDGTVTGETFGACSGDLPGGVARLSDGTTEIGMWRFPFDPALPGLPVACDPERARRLVLRSGVRADGPVRVRVRAYRPRRRAVVELGLPGRRRVFVKVVPPARAAGLHRRHRLAEGAAVPESLGWTDDGLVLLAGLPGRTLREELLAGGDGPVPLDPDSVTAALDGLPPALAAGPRRRTWGQKAGHYAGVLADAVPGLAGRVHAIARAVDHGEPEGPGVPVHGDFYESQLMVRDGLVTGLLDLDTAGRGERLDDEACLLAHLAVLAQTRPALRPRVDDLRDRVHRHLTRSTDPAALARRTAAVVLSLATGPHRVQEPGWPARTEQRVALAEQWLDRA